MTNFYIVPQEQEIVIDGKDKDDAICNFATSMDPDMNRYFKVLTPEEYEQYCKERSDAEAHKRFVIAFMRSKLVKNFNMQGDAAQDVAEVAYDIYECGDGQTEYECIEEAYSAWKNSTADA